MISGDQPERYDTPNLAEDLPHSLRVNAILRLTTRGEGNSTRVIARHEAGALRMRMPRRSGSACEATIVNVAGGLAGGDRVNIAIDAQSGSELLVSSAAAERIYRSANDTTQISISLRADAGAKLVWIPNESILHRGARLKRHIDATFNAKGRFLFADILQLGRSATGEIFDSGDLHESWRFRDEGGLVFAEEMRLGESALAHRLSIGGLAGHSSLATVLLGGLDAEEHVETLRSALYDEPTVRSGVSAHSGLVFARMMSKSDLALRRVCVRAIRAVSAGLPLPRLMLGDEP
ncbi:UreH Urease accessory protein UreH [Rhabdaerophilaceae bacterium]